MSPPKCCGKVAQRTASNKRTLLTQVSSPPHAIDAEVRTPRSRLVVTKRWWSFPIISEVTIECSRHCKVDAQTVSTLVAYQRWDTDRRRRVLERTVTMSILASVGIGMAASSDIQAPHPT